MGINQVYVKLPVKPVETIGLTNLQRAEFIQTQDITLESMIEGTRLSKHPTVLYIPDNRVIHTEDVVHSCNDKSEIIPVYQLEKTSNNNYAPVSPRLRCNACNHPFMPEELNNSFIKTEDTNIKIHPLESKYMTFLLAGNNNTELYFSELLMFMNSSKFTKKTWLSENLIDAFFSQSGTEKGMKYLIPNLVQKEKRLCRKLPKKPTNLNFYRLTERGRERAKELEQELKESKIRNFIITSLLERHKFLEENFSKNIRQGQLFFGDSYGKGKNSVEEPAIHAIDISKILSSDKKFYWEIYNLLEKEPNSLKETELSKLER
jgi:hypothetical protein